MCAHMTLLTLGLTAASSTSSPTLVMKRWMPVFFILFPYKIITVCTVVGINIIGNLRIFGAIHRYKMTGKCSAHMAKYTFAVYSYTIYYA